VLRIREHADELAYLRDLIMPAATG
jgi:hypothetical protein